jgi:hypothetical protein
VKASPEKHGGAFFMECGVATRYLSGQNFNKIKFNRGKTRKGRGFSQEPYLS